MPQRYDRFWLHDTSGVFEGVHIWRASLGADPYTHRFYVRLLLVPLDQPAGCAMFAAMRRQADVCKSARHPHILQVYAHGEAAGRGWVAVEEPEGYDLQALMQTLRHQRLRLPVPLAVHIVLQVLRGLDFLHGLGLVHGTVDAGSVFMGARNQAKLAASTGDAPFNFHTLAPPPSPDALDRLDPGDPLAPAQRDVRDAARLLQTLLLAQSSGRMPALPAVPDSVTRVLRAALTSRPLHRRIDDAVAMYRHLAACEIADAMPDCEPLLRVWGQHTRVTADVARLTGSVTPRDRQALRALFGAPTAPPRRKSLLQRITRT